MKHSIDSIDKNSPSYILHIGATEIKGPEWYYEQGIKRALAQHLNPDAYTKDELIKHGGGVPKDSRTKNIELPTWWNDIYTISNKSGKPIKRAITDTSKIPGISSTQMMRFKIQSFIDAPDPVDNIPDSVKFSNNANLTVAQMKKVLRHDVGLYDILHQEIDERYEYPARDRAMQSEFFIKLTTPKHT